MNILSGRVKVTIFSVFALLFDWTSRYYNIVIVADNINYKVAAMCHVENANIYCIVHCTHFIVWNEKFLISWGWVYNKSREGTS